MKKKYTSPYLIFGLLSATITLLTLFLILPHSNLLVAYLVGINLSTFLLYGYDKYVARSKRGLRVPEWNLHALALMGGSPAGLLAQKFFHHKTLKGSFQLVYWGIVFGQIGLLFWIEDSKLAISAIRSVGSIA